MSNKNIKFNYDEENDMLFIYNSKNKSRGSIEYGKDIHISFSPRGELAGLEILNASEVFHEIFNKPIDRECLSCISSCDLWDEKKRGLRIIKFTCSIKRTEKPLDGQLVIQDIDYRSPILAAAR